MLKKFDIHEWIVSVKHWSLLFIPHLSIYLIYIFYILIGASIIQEIESDRNETISSTKNFHQERERLLIKIIEKREIFDLPQYTRYVYKHIRQYEEEIKRHVTFEEDLPLNFSKSLFIISTTLTTIGSNEFVPKNQIGKLFLIIYTGFGIPLTLVFITDLSYLIKKMIMNFFLYLSKFSRRIRRILFSRFLEELSISSSKSSITMIQLLLTLFVYLLLGTYFISSKSFTESFYLIFTSLFTINFHRQIYQNHNFCLTMIYVFFGLAIVLLCIEAVKRKMEIFLTNIGNKLLQNLVELTQQMGFHDLTTDDLLGNVDSLSVPDFVTFPSRHLSRTISLDQSSSLRPIGIAEPLRRLSTGIIRAFKINDNDDSRHADKSVQVSTIIRRCGRCAETSLPIRPLRKHSAITSLSSSSTDNNNSTAEDEDDDVMDFPPPNLDRIRQRRATLVAKTIISQLATQPRSSIDDLMPPFMIPSMQRHRSAGASPILMRSSMTLSPPPLDSPDIFTNREQFSEISKQISSLLTPCEDENE